MVKEFKDLSKELRKDSIEAKKRLDAMRKGETPLPYNTQASVVIQVNRGLVKYLFRNEVLKRSEVAKQQGFVVSLERARVQLKPEPDEESILKL